MDQPKIDQHLSVVRHRQMCEHTAHQDIPIGNAAGGVVALVAIRRRGEAKLRGVTLHQRGDHGWVGGVATDQPVRADGPDISLARHRHHWRVRYVIGRIGFIGVYTILRRRFCFGGRGICQQRIDLDVFEAGQRQFETRFGKLRHFERQHLLIPASVKRQPVVGDDQGALLRGGEMGQFDHRHLIQPQLACSSQTTVARDDAVVTINQDRVRPAIFDDAGGDLGDLRIGMCARIAGVGNQRLDLAVLDVERIQRGCPENRKPADDNRGRVLGLV